MRNDNISERQMLNKPIGLLNYNYDFLIESLSRNIGDFNKNIFNIGTPIGEPANYYANSHYIPWFYADDYKSLSSNYIDYIQASYFNGTGELINYFSADDKLRFFNIASLDTYYNHVGAVQSYDYYNVYSYGNANFNNKFNDTRMGYINNFYLSTTIQNSIMESKYRVLNMGGGITKGIYDKFSIDGTYGMLSNTMVGSYNPFSMPQHQNSISGDVMFINKNISPDSSITNSMDLLNLNTDITNNFLVKSLLGYDLLDVRDLKLEDLDSLSSYNGKKYIPSFSINVRRDYVSSIADVFVLNDDENRFEIKEFGANAINSGGILYSYDETENGNTNQISLSGTYNLGVNYGKYEKLDNIKENTILNKTNELFKRGKIDTILARFKTGEMTSKDEYDLITSKSQYGMSRGRNLLKREPSNENGYDNPYCRVWTFHHQYKSLEDTIRPYNDVLKNSDVEFYRTQGDENDNYNAFQGGIDRLNRYGVKNPKTNMVRYAVYKKSDGEGNMFTKPEQCMFSIENLAWKGTNSDVLDDDQKGPLGGRIMWFPPYNLKFDENVSVNWSTTNFIGRGEDIYTYVNTSRGGTLSFKLLIDYPSIINKWAGGDNSNTQNSGVDAIESDEQTLLRFFAGCEILDQLNNNHDFYPDKPFVLDAQPPVIRKNLSFVVYFPNNYSGVDDLNNSEVTPIMYLLNGVGANRFRYTDESDDDITDLRTHINEKYTIVGHVTGKDDNGDDTIGTKLNGMTYGGYEMGDNGLSMDGGFKYRLSDYHYVFNTNDNKNGELVLTSFNIDNSDIKWGYRVDKGYAKEKLRKDSYDDVKSYKLNSDGYKNGLKYHNTLSEDDSCSFLDACVALTNIKWGGNGAVNDNNVTKFKKILENFDIDEVTLAGYASTHGNKSNNETLAKNRAKTIEAFLKNSHKKFQNAKFSPISIGDSADVTGKSVSSLDAKVWRSVVVTIKYAVSESTPVLEYPNELTMNKTIDTNNVNKILENGVNETTFKEVQDYLNRIKTQSKNQSLINERIKNIVNTFEKKLNEVGGYNEQKQKKNQIKKNNGYHDEYKFFSELEKNEPFMHNLVTQKIKYFDPAFHSISPEGFNARLTFLHQCTRQGGTNSQSESQTNAANLSFGRPPICVLRVGDFYNTKIIIESLTISYDDTTWDLNPEGIGVMPMMADINITFKFIGGSDLGGPIARLQNALSFNYYANTGVYDSRSDMVEYNNEGKISKIKIS